MTFLYNTHIATCPCVLCVCCVWQELVKEMVAADIALLSKNPLA